MDGIASFDYDDAFFDVLAVSRVHVQTGKCELSASEEKGQIADVHTRSLYEYGE